MKKFIKYGEAFLHVHFVTYTCVVLILSASMIQAQFVTNHNAIPQPSVSKPALMVQTTDPKFGTKLLRLSDARSQNLPGIIPQYSKRQAWNANDSLMLLISGNGNTLLYNGKTYQYIRELSGVYGEDIFWHPTNPDVIICTDNQALLSYNVPTDNFDTIAVFAQYAWFNTRGEGNLTNDGRYYAFVGQTYDSTVHFKDIVVYDLIAKNIIKTMPLPESLNDFDWVSVSPLGNYVVIDYATTINARYNGIEVYDRNMNFIWQKPVGAGHSDLGIDANGDEILVMDYYDDQTNSSRVKKFRLADGQETNLIEMDWSFDSHTSCRNTSRPGWCIISTFDGEGRLTDDSTTWLPFEDEIFALKLDGSGDVQRIAHHHSKRFSPATPDRDNSVYYAEPHATVSRDGSRILFGSNWRMNVESDTSVDTYLIDIKNLLNVRNEKSQPDEIQLSQNYPNPFKTSTVIGYQVAAATYVRLEVFDLLGRKVATLVDEQKDAGEYTSKFSVGRFAEVRSPSAGGGFEVNPGVYLYRLTSGSMALYRKAVIVK